jgi:hypothetical protein
MNRNILAIVLLPAFCFLLVFSCDWKPGSSDYKSFDYDLQGTWETNESDSRYTGMLVIDYNRITITGYGESQTPVFGGSDVERPFRNFTKGVPISGYSKDGKIFIEDSGIVQEGIPYTYYYSPDLTEVGFLRFDFGGRAQTLRKQ